MIVKKNQLIPMWDKIADITEANTTLKYLNFVDMGLPANTIAIIMTCQRISGTGFLNVYCDGGTRELQMGIDKKLDQLIYTSTLQALKYNLTVANDDFELYCQGYMTQRGIVHR